MRYWESTALISPATERIMPFLNLELSDFKSFMPINIKIYPTMSLVISMCTEPIDIQNLVQIRKMPISTNNEFFCSYY